MIEADYYSSIYELSKGIREQKMSLDCLARLTSLTRTDSPPLLALVRVALESDGPQAQPAASTRRLIRQTKKFLKAELANPIRLSHVGRAVGASPAYLTDVFRRVEGVSLHRYLTQLRLARALAGLPDADDLTALALGIGFSSHSHFSVTFRRVFGCTPSQFRQTARGRQHPSSAVRRRPMPPLSRWH